jgi:hypothetical protein
MNSATLSRSQLISFYFQSLLNKLRIFTECQEGKLQLLIVEALWTLRPFTGIAPDSNFLIYKNFLKTKFGKFYVHPDLQSEISLSPAFERQDIDHLLTLIGKEIQKKQKVLFIDIGAHVGVYTVAIGNRFKKYKKQLDIIAFEPNASNFYSDNFSLLKKNIAENNINNVKAYNKGLGSKKTNKPNKYGITTVTLDSLLPVNFYKKYDVVFVKADIEGYETDAFKGAGNLIHSAKKLIVIVEDCVDQGIISYLKKQKFLFSVKLTPYNSFWIKS